MPRYKKRADGRYIISLSLGTDENGKRIRKSVYGKTPKEVEEKVEELKLKMHQGIKITSKNDSFEIWSKRWLKLKKTEISNGQLGAHKSNINHLQPIANIPLDKIKTNDIQDIILTLSEKNPNTNKPASKKTLLGLKSTAKQIFKLAIENRVINYNPAEAVKIPKGQPETHRRALTEDEQKWILQTEHNAKTSAMIMMFAGLRLGELIPLTWNDIDLKNGTININKAVERKGNKYIIKNSAKSEAGLRTIYIPQILIDYLSNLKKKSIFLTTKSNGEMHTYSSWRRLWESYLYDLNLKYGYNNQKNISETEFKKYTPEKIPEMIPHITPHWLRHTFATMLYHAGVDPVNAKDQLGHTDITTTLNIYTHLDRKHKKLSTEKINYYIANGSQKVVNEND